MISIRYDREFFNFLKITSVESARHIIPICLDLINPKKVIDVGCGRGSFLKIFADNGVEFIYGIDGEWVNEADLDIPLKFFRYVNLEKEIQIYDKFDLVICLEVAEHLTPGRASSFVDDLCRLSDVVLFSAAIPFQGGTSHINERPITYWADLFKKNNYVWIDSIRKKIWNKTSFWYSQNCILFVKEAAISSYPSLQLELGLQGENLMDFIHPEVFRKNHFLNITGRDYIALLPCVILKLIKKIKKLIWSY
jgi:SAM-dependent methyltransferase